MNTDRRSMPRERQDWQPHPDLIRECAAVAEFYGADMGVMGDDVIRRVLVAATAWQQRQDADARAHAIRRDDPARLAGLLELTERVQRRQGGGR